MMQLGQTLARSAAVDTISLSPGNVLYSNGTVVPNDILASAFSEIFSLDYNETLEKLNSSSSVVTIAKKVEKEIVENLKKWMEDNDIISGINIDEDYKRYYPYENLASSVIGFCGDDNQGLEGIESAWDDVLTGTPRSYRNINKCK